MTRVCIVGGGAAGCLMALRLVRRGLRVTVLESGPWFSDDEKAALYHGVRTGSISGSPYRREGTGLGQFRNAGPVKPPLQSERVHAVGGSTLHWMGNCPRMLPDDFRLRSRFGLGDDWPLTYEELEPWYVLAEREIGVAGAEDNRLAGPRSAPYPMPALPLSYGDKVLKRTIDRLGVELHHTPQARNSREYGGRRACQACGLCHVCPTRAKATLDVTHGAPARDLGAEFITGATVLRLEAGPGDRVRRAVYATDGRVERAVEADVFVVAGGGIETPRLLLLSAGAGFAGGLANRSGLVGRRFMNHPLVRVEGELDEPVFPFRVGFESAESFHWYATGERAAAGAFLVTLSNTEGRQPAALARGGRDWGDALARRVRAGFGRTVSLIAQTEQLPGPDNAVDLDPEAKDRFGLPVPRLTYAFDAYTREAMARAEAELGGLLEAAGARGVARRGAGWPGHHLGTTRMGADPATSVVNPWLQSHDLPNLYLATTGAFVTGGAANPTLTLAALALRAADHIAGGGRP